MEADQIAATLQKIVRDQLQQCEEAVRDQDPVRALNDLADAKKAIKSLIRALKP